MWKAVLVAALAFVPLAAAQSGSPEGSVRAEASPGVQCQIRVKSRDGGVELEGVIVAETPVSGTYSFDVRKSGSAGTSNSVQSGNFEVQAGEETIGQVVLGLETGASYDASLVLRWQAGEVACAAIGPDQA